MSAAGSELPPETMPPEPDLFDPITLIAALAAAEVDFVVIGGVAGGSHGSVARRPTFLSCTSIKNLRSGRFRGGYPDE